MKNVYLPLVAETESFGRACGRTSYANVAKHKWHHPMVPNISWNECIIHKLEEEEVNDKNLFFRGLIPPKKNGDWDLGSSCVILVNAGTARWKIERGRKKAYPD